MELGFVATRDLVGAAQWTTAAFTTYALSLSFFEAVVLDLMVRRRSAAPVVFADVAGVRSALSEYGARRVGRDYDVEPVALSGGVFHPKVTVLADGTDAHLVVGSGNLTFGGWAGNLECAEHLHPSFAADAFADAEDFFVSIALESRLKHEALGKFESTAARLGLAAAAGPRHGRIRLLHSLAGSLSAQISDYAADLGGASRLVVASPYWDDGRGLQDLCSRLGLDHAYVHAHPFGVVEAGVAENWPRGAQVEVRPVEVAALCEAAAKRPMHSKLFEVLCKRGRLVVSGSANASSAALGATGNIEAVVLRMWREPQAGWRLDPAAALPSKEIPEAGDAVEAASEPAVLRAEMEGEVVTGRILGAFPPGPASALQVSVEGAEVIEEAQVGADRRFVLEAARLELEAWRSGRLVLRLTSGDVVAEGFVAFRDLQDVRRRAGASASRLLAVMAHVDAPGDAVALMSWFQEHPEALVGAARIGGGGHVPGPPRPTFTDVGTLLRPNAPSPANGAEGGPPSPGWSRFVDRLMGTLAEPRSPFDAGGDDDPDEGVDSAEVAARKARARQREADRRSRQSAKAMQVFDAVFDRMLSKPAEGNDYSGLFALTQYVCNRLAPDVAKAREYLGRLTDAFLVGRAPSALGTAAAAVLVSAALEPNPNSGVRRARSRLLRLGWDMTALSPDLGLAGGFLSVFGLSVDGDELWSATKAARTTSEEIRAYRTALETGAARPELVVLPLMPEWPELERAFQVEPRRRGVRFVDQGARRCPCSTTVLPDGERHRLASSHVARASCGHVLLCETD